MMCIQAHYSSPLTASVCRPLRDEVSLVTWVRASPDFPLSKLQNLTFSQRTGVQQLLFLLKTHFSAARQPAHLSPCHDASAFGFSVFPKAFRVNYSSLSLYVAEARWCATKGGCRLPSLTATAHIWRGLWNRNDSPEFEAIANNWQPMHPVLDASYR